MLSKRELCQSWRLYAITDGSAEEERSLPDRVKKALEGGASVVQLRDKRSSDDSLLKLAEKILKITRQAKVPLIINDRVHVALRSGAEGLHLGQEDGALSAARKLLGDKAIIGRSTHSQAQVIEAEREGFDYIGVGPVFGTPTKPDYTPVGLELVRFASQNVRVPFVAIGGIDRENVGKVIGAGAKTVAVVRAVIGSSDPKSAAQELLRRFNEG